MLTPQGTCQALLLNPLSTAQADINRRALFQAQVIDYNGALADVCAQFRRCRFDGGAGFNTAFTRDDVATLSTVGATADYFHPSLHGQATIAGVVWGATFSFD